MQVNMECLYKKLLQSVNDYFKCPRLDRLEVTIETETGIYHLDDIIVNDTENQNKEKIRHIRIKTKTI